MSLLLRLAALVSLLWAIYLLFPQSVALVPLAATSATAVPANGLGIANVGFAYLFWRAASNPSGERSAIYTALLVFGLRAANDTYEVLYVLNGKAAVASLIDLVLSLALFVGMLNALPSTLMRHSADSRP